MHFEISAWIPIPYKSLCFETELLVENVDVLLEIILISNMNDYEVNIHPPYQYADLRRGGKAAFFLGVKQVTFIYGNILFNSCDN